MSDPTAKPTAGDPFANASTNPDKPPALPDLPPVEAPSAGFVVQLFVIPAAVVVVVIIVWLLFGKLAGGERDAMEYVRQLRLPPANWRSAFELASLIQNDQAIASDPKLLGELTDLLSHELDRAEDPKQAEDPKLAQYLALTLGAFRTLEAQTQSGQVVDPIDPLARALEPKFDKAIRIAAAASLAKQAARLDGKLDDSRAVKALGQMAADENPQVRQIAALRTGLLRRPRGRAGPPRSHPNPTRTGSCATTPPSRSAAAAIRPPSPPSARCSPPPTSTRSSRWTARPSSRTPPPPASTASRRSSSRRSMPSAASLDKPAAPARPLAPPRGREAHQVRAGQRPRPGRRSLAGPGRGSGTNGEAGATAAAGWPDRPCKKFTAGRSGCAHTRCMAALHRESP